MSQIYNPEEALLLSACIILEGPTKYECQQEVKSE